MSEDKNNPVNLDEQYKAMIEDNENNAPVEAEEPVDLGKVDMNKFKPQEAKEADFHLGYHSVSHAELPSGGMFYNEKSEISFTKFSQKTFEKFSFSLTTSILVIETFLSFCKIFIKVLPIEPVDPKIAIFFFIIKMSSLKKIDMKMEKRKSYHLFYLINHHDQE